ncbi:MAG: hypothetical protein ABIJ09_02415 [Pseudomonadota bacterium]
MNEIKRHLFETMLQTGIVLLTFLDSVDATEVPDEVWLEDMGSVKVGRLKYSYGYQVDDFDFDAVGVRATLSFGARACWTFVPWEAVVGIEQLGLGSIFLQEAPHQVPVKCPETKRPGGLRVVSDDEGGE